ncbi:MAG: hypothetical protein ABJA64_03155 [Candidatus Saccharibacteria bacterium]
MPEILNAELSRLRDSSRELLKELVTPEGIYASAQIGWEGPYHAWFGRDGAITADFILASIEYGGDQELATVAVNALKNYSKWQGKENNKSIGEEVGKIPHEIRTEFNAVDTVQHAAGTNAWQWYVDQQDNTLKNWDTADGTSLWTLALLRSRSRLNLELDDETIGHVRSALEWIVGNVHSYGGLVGFTGAEMQEGREYSGLHNQGWKDSESVYQTSEGENAPHPIKDVLVNAEAWAALSDGAEYFKESDTAFSHTLQMAADTIKEKFNSQNEGFVVDGLDGLAQAIDGTGSQLKQSSVDQGAVLWARTERGEVCVDDEMINTLVKKVMSPEMFNPDAGVRDYARGTVFTHGTNYHGSPNTYWPFMSGMIARGMQQGGYEEEARQVMRAFLNAVQTLGTNIEMFIQDDNDSFEPWSHPDPEIGQKSSREQAWTAAAVYYATSYLLHKSEVDSGDTLN